MTIVSAVFVPEGIVLSADSRLSGIKHENGIIIDEFHLNDNMEKIIQINHGKFGLALNGHSDYKGKPITEILKEFDDTCVLESDSLVDVSHKLRDYFHNNYYDMDTSFYLSGYQDNQQYVLRLSKDFIRLENYNQKEKFFHGISCSGNLEIADAMVQMNRMNFKEMDIHKAINLAEFYVKTTIKWLGFNEGYSNCGGPIDTLVITKKKTYYHKRKINTDTRHPI
jgi:hypothetical protein